MRIEGLFLVAVCGLASPLFTAQARAQQQVDTGTEGIGHNTAERSTAKGVFMRFGESPAMDGHKVAVSSHVGGDTSRESAAVETRGEVVVYGRRGFHVGLIGGGSYIGAARGLPEQSAGFGGVKAQLLSQAQHGIDGAISVQYTSRGFNLVPAIASQLMIGRSFGDTQLLFNVTYGGGLEEAERFGTVRAAALTRVYRELRVGVDARALADLEFEWEEPEGEPEIEVNGGAVVSYAFSHLSLSALAGPTALRYRDGTDTFRVGALFSLGVGVTL